MSSDKIDLTIATNDNFILGSNLVEVDSKIMSFSFLKQLKLNIYSFRLVI